MTKEIYNIKKDRPIIIDYKNCLKKYGVPNAPIVINWDTVDKIFLKHGIPKEDLGLLKEQISDNLLLASSLTRNDSIVIFIGQWDNEGRPIMLSLALNKYDNETKVHKITSVYGRNNTSNFIKKLYEENKILFYDKNAYLWFKTIGIDLPEEMNNSIVKNIETNYICKYQICMLIIKKN